MIGAWVWGPASVCERGHEDACCRCQDPSHPIRFETGRGQKSAALAIKATRNQPRDRQPAGSSLQESAHVMSRRGGVPVLRVWKLIHSRHHITSALWTCHTVLQAARNAEKQQTRRAATRAQGCCAGSDCPKRQSRVVWPNRGPRDRDLVWCTSNQIRSESGSTL